LAQFFERRFHRGFVKTEITRTSIAFGGGILVAAVAFVLVPEGMAVLSVIPMAGFFSAGAISGLFNELCQP
jgi:ZIP family zinc transporter